jgi:hypothetical protein
MEQTISFRDTLGRMVFRIMGGLALLLALLWNPMVLRPRFWNATVVAREVAVEVTLIVVGIGLVCVRKWAAIGVSVVAALLLVEGGTWCRRGLCLPHVVYSGRIVLARVGSWQEKRPAVRPCGCTHKRFHGMRSLRFPTRLSQTESVP